MSEISTELGVTPQAVLKHIRVLEREGVVRALNLGEVKPGLVRQVYELKVPFEVQLEEKRGIIMLSVLCTNPRKITLNQEKRSEEVAGSLVEAVDRLDEDQYYWKRRLRSLRNRELHIFEEIARLHSARKLLFAERRLGPLEQIVLEALLSPDPRSEIDAVERFLHIDRSRIAAILEKRLGERIELP